MRSATLLAICALSASASAQLTSILPASATGVAGTSQNAFPWGTTASGWPGLRILCLYDSSHFTAAPASISTPVLITNVRWRANDVTTSWTGGTYSSATLALATAAVDHAAASTNWATNLGPDYTIVHNGPVTVLPGTGNGVGVPGPYVVDIPVVPPFLYDPTLGDLCVDTNFLAGTWGGGTQVGMDVHSTNLLARRVYSSSMYPNANGVDASVPVIEVSLLPAGPGSFGTNTALGDGCVRSFASAYESFATAAAFDLSNSAMSLLASGTGYIGVPGVVGFVPPTPAAALVAVGDNVQETVTLSSPFPFPGGTTSALTVCSNGFVSVATGNGTGTTPSVTTMLNFAQTAWGDWHNYLPTGGANGNVKHEEVGSLSIFTWDAVLDFGTGAGPNTWQLQFDRSTGSVHFVWGTMSLAGNGHLVFYSRGGPSVDPGNTDLSVALPTTGITIVGVDVLALAVAATSRPVAGTSWNLDVTNIPATGLIGVDIFGLADPGINDLGFLGMPGCGLRATLDLLSGWLVIGSSHAHSFPLPASPGLVGIDLFTTSAVFQVPPVNAFGAITSNGIKGHIGDL